MTGTLLFQSISAPLSTVASGILAIAISQTAVLHFNARLLLTGFAIASVITNTGMTVYSIQVLVYIFGSNDIDRCYILTFSSSQCRDMRRLYSLGRCWLILSLFVIAIERTIATIWCRIYEKRNYHYIGLSLAVIQYALPFVLVYGVHSSDPQSRYLYCDNELTIAKKDYAGIVVCVIVLQMIAIVTFIALWSYNIARKRLSDNLQMQSLQTQYQLNENVTTTKTMIPLVALNAFMLSARIALLIFAYPSHYDPTTPKTKSFEEVVVYAHFSELQRSLTPISTFIAVVCFTKQNVHVRNSLRKLLMLGSPKNKVRPQNGVSNVQAVTNAYFSQLAKQWL
ncbi:hypothetical protein AB6A40_004341 [Gnathostoma spinigerum]|uniref:G-protein coupled receptors family 1 profile domain-containing protein n=1 Tax=Gnathostoma spinigerum TaxID=75299 RepID=A0ABD6EM39_9BILA